MKVAYLTSRYPKISHTFIRREIEGVEAAGIEVDRISIRSVEEPLVDPADVAEEGRTFFLLASGAAVLLGNLLAVGLSHPLRMLGALRTTLSMSRRSERGLVTHLAYVAEASLLARRCAKSGAAHVHAHFGNNPAAVALLCRELGGPPFSFTAHGTGSFADPAAVSLGLKLARARFTVAVCEFGRDELQRWAPPGSAPELHVIHCGLDRSFLDAPATSLPEAPRLLCVARLGREKGLHVLLEALGRIAANGTAFELTVIGDGDERPELETQARKLGLAEHVHFAGWKSSAEVLLELKRTRLFVLPSFSEGLPVVVMEALALRRPVVATRVGGVPELVRPGETGWLVEPRAAGALAEALGEALSTDTATLEGMGARGAELVTANHDAAREAEKLANLFRR